MRAQESCMLDAKIRDVTIDNLIALRQGRTLTSVMFSGATCVPAYPGAVVRGKSPPARAAGMLELADAKIGTVTVERNSHAKVAMETAIIRSRAQRAAR